MLHSKKECCGLWIMIAEQYYRIVANIWSIPDGLLHDRQQIPCIP
jgi:hypothetical protein